MQSLGQLSIGYLVLLMISCSSLADGGVLALQSNATDVGGEREREVRVQLLTSALLYRLPASSDKVSNSGTPVDPPSLDLIRLNATDNPVSRGSGCVSNR